MKLRQVLRWWRAALVAGTVLALGMTEAALFLHTGDLPVLALAVVSGVVVYGTARRRRVARPEPEAHGGTRLFWALGIAVAVSFPLGAVSWMFAFVSSSVAIATAIIIASWMLRYSRTEARPNKTTAAATDGSSVNDATR